MELFEQGLLPRVISGVSAGSLVVAMIGYDIVEYSSLNSTEPELMKN